MGNAYIFHMADNMKYPVVWPAVISICTASPLSVAASTLEESGHKPTCNRQTDETNKYRIFLVNVNPTDEGCILELRDPKGIYGNQSIMGESTPHKQKESRETDSSEAVRLFQYAHLFPNP